MGYYPRRPYIRAMPQRPQPPAEPSAAESVVVDAQVAPATPTPAANESMTLQRFRTESSDEWNDYVWRTRNLLIARYYSNPDVIEARAWVNQNIEDIGNRIGTYYGATSATETKRLMTECLDRMLNVLDYLRNAPSNFELETDRQLGEMLMRWRDCVDTLVNFLSSLNPTWNQIDLKNTLDDFREFWWNQIRSRRTAEWNRDLSYLDRAFDNAAKMSAIVVKGITEQHASSFL